MYEITVTQSNSSCCVLVLVYTLVWQLQMWSRVFQSPRESTITRRTTNTRRTMDPPSAPQVSNFITTYLHVACCFMFLVNSLSALLVLVVLISCAILNNTAYSFKSENYRINGLNKSLAPPGRRWWLSKEDPWIFNFLVGLRVMYCYRDPRCVGAKYLIRSYSCFSVNNLL